jgi:hypothetical protein
MIPSLASYSKLPLFNRINNVRICSIYIIIVFQFLNSNTIDYGNKVKLSLIRFLASYKTFYIDVLNLSSQYFFSLKKPSSSRARVLSFVKC